MKQTSFISSLIHHHYHLTTLFFFFFLLKTCQSIDDQQYLDCGVPQTCGDGGQNISYPFYIEDLHKPHCGFPGFELSCNSNNQPIINLSSNIYVVHDIFYENQSIRISNAEFLSNEPNSTNCFPIPIRNLTLLGNRLDFALNNMNLFVWSNCSSNLTSHEVGSCSDDKVAMILENDPNFGNVSRNCRNGVKVPVELDGEIGEDSEYYERLLRRGFLLNWSASNCSVCQQSGGRCGFDYKMYQFRCFCPDRPHALKCNPIAGDRRRALKLGLGIGISAVGFGILMMVAYCCCSRKFSSTKSVIFWKNKENRTNQNIEVFLKNTGSFAPKRYSYSDVKRMTNSFKDELGKGGFGCVYKGRLNDDRLVAVKILNNSKGKNGEEFMNELASISRTSHVNIVTLLGFCFDGSHRALIYEFMPNGSLEKFIYDKIPQNSNRQLGWETLYRIAIGIARGLEYLHRGCNTRILHFDIKPHNILLDGDFCPKISDFGLAKLCSQKESIISMLGARGTVGYIAPEVFCRTIGGVSHKSDVYSFGMMVLEMVGGRKNIDVGVGMDHTSQIYFPHWIYNRIESNNELGLRGVEITMDDEENEKARKMILVSLWCIQTDPSNRPPMSRVLEMLEGKLESLQLPPKPFLSSPSRN